MANLNKMPNIGKTLEKRLQNVGISDAETLVTEGSEAAFMKLRLFEGDTCFSTLCALEGAIQNIRWHYLSNEKKNKLKKFFDEGK